MDHYLEAGPRSDICTFTLHKHHSTLHCTAYKLSPVLQGEGSGRARQEAGQRQDVGDTGGRPANPRGLSGLQRRPRGNLLCWY